MGLKEILEKAFTLSNEWKFFVQVDEEDIKEMTYLELGMFITSKVEKIDIIHIITRD